MQVDINDLARYFTQIDVRIINVGRAVIQPGRKCFGVYTPPFSGLIFPLRGRARMFFDGVPYEMEAGKIYHGGPNMALDKEGLGTSEWEFMVIHYQVDCGEEHLFPYAFSHYHLETGSNTRINDLLYRLYHVCETQGHLSALKAKALFLNILDEIVTSAANCRSDRGGQLIEQAVVYINTHYMEPVTIPKLAAQYGLNSKQFSYLFQKHIGMGPNEYLIACRVRRAKELLYTTTCSVAEVSACVGYSDPYYFSKLFKKRTGFCPSDLRIELSKQVG
jgi:AraC-like DNA-binding protein